MCLDLIGLDIVFFGESLPSEFYHNLDEDSEKVWSLFIFCLFALFISFFFFSLWNCHENVHCALDI